MYKLFFALLLFCLWSPRTIVGQTEYAWKQVIKKSLGNDSLTILVLDYNTEYPIDKASIKFCQSDKIIFFTNSDGLISISKTNIKYFEVSKTEYFPLCVALENENVDYVTILLEKIPYSLGYNKNPKGYPLTVGLIFLLMNEGHTKAEEDIANNKLQIYMNIQINDEQMRFSKKYEFAFIQDNEKPIEYKYAYNETVLNYLTDSYGDVFREEMVIVCWCNSY